MSGFLGGVEIDVDDIVEHPYCKPNRLFERFVIELAIDDVSAQVDAAKITYSGFRFAGV